MRDARFSALLERESTRQRTEAERLLSIHRPRAVAALGRVLDASERDGEAVPLRDVLSAAQTLIGASAPPSERQRQQARLDLLRQLPSKLRREVADALTSANSEWLASLSDDELDRLLAEDAR
jgi:hypothetical protein